TLAQLAQVTPTPANCPMKYLYAYPADLAGEVRAVRCGPRADDRDLRFFTADVGIACDHASAWAEYSAQRPEASWSVWFVELVATAFAADIARRRPDMELADRFWQ